MTASNNGMHPTRFSMDVIRIIECLIHCLRAGDAGRYAALLIACEGDEVLILHEGEGYENLPTSFNC